MASGAAISRSFTTPRSGNLLPRRKEFNWDTHTCKELTASSALPAGVPLPRAVLPALTWSSLAPSFRNLFRGDLVSLAKAEGTACPGCWSLSPRSSQAAPRPVPSVIFICNACSAGEQSGSVWWFVVVFLFFPLRSVFGEKYLQNSLSEGLSSRMLAGWVCWFGSVFVCPAAQEEIVTLV